MKSIVILPIVLLLALISSCSRDTISGSDELTSEFRNVINFTKVSSEGVFEVTITQSDFQSVEIIANENIVHKVKTVVAGNELRLYLDDDYNYQNLDLQVNIFVPSINSVKNSGSGNIQILDVDNDSNFNINNSGSGDISIAGSSTSLSIKNEGSGNIIGFDFFVNDCNVEIEGSGDLEISCSDYLNVEIDGSGSVYYKGNPTIDVDISGSGQVVNDN